MNLASLQTAIHTRLNAVADVTSRVNGGVLYDHPQDDDAGVGTVFPYITISEASVAPWDTKTSDGSAVLVQVSAWARDSATTGRHLLVKQVGDAVYNALHKFDLVVSGGAVVNCLFDSSPGPINDPDGETVHLPVTYRVTMDEI